MRERRLDAAEIKERLDVEAYFAAQGLHLIGAGDERKALCPFHQEDTPSFTVTLSSGLWHCFGCGQGGDVIEFHKRTHGVEFQDALQALASFTGAGGNGTDTPTAPRRERPEALVIPDEEIDMLHDMLLCNSKLMAYLKKEKGLSEDTIRQYRLGWDEERICIPVPDREGVVRNLRRYLPPPRSSKALKFLNVKGSSATWFPIHALDEEAVVIVAGEWDMLLARQELGINAVTQTAGEGTFKREWAELFRDKHVVLCYDNDEAGDVGATRVMRELEGVAAEVVRVRLPVEHEGGDMSDWVLGGGTRAAWDALVEAARREAKKDDAGPRELPEIDAGQGDLAALADEAWAAIEAWNDPPELFQRGGMITVIRTDDDGNPELAHLTQDGVRGLLARVARWYRWQKRGEEFIKADAMPPMGLVKDMMTARQHSGGFPLPFITRLVEAPVYGADGSLQTTPGYHPGSRSFYVPVDPSVVIEPPDPARVDEAVSLLTDDLLGDFPFVGEAERAHALAAMLSPFVREMVDGPTPLYLIEAPSPGTGKGLLADMITFPATGRPAAVLAEGRDDEEWRKRITAELIKAPTFVLLDNLRGRLDSGVLAALLTSSRWEDRLLGASTIVSLPVRTIWLATANNPALSTEMARRTLRIRMDAKVSRPWQRQGFKHDDLRAWARENHARLVWAALTLIQNWLDAERPQGDKTLGRYEAYTRMMGGILGLAGVTGFLDNLEELYEDADEETAQWEAFVSAWWATHQRRATGVRELFRLAEEGELLLNIRGDRSEQSQKVRLGNALKAMRGRRIGGFEIRATGKDGQTKSATYQLVEAIDEEEGVSTSA